MNIDRLYERVADNLGETWSFLSDFTGEKGDAATITVGNVTTVAADVDATVSNSGTTSAAVLDFNIPQGATGTDGVSRATQIEITDGDVVKDQSFVTGEFIYSEYSGDTQVALDIEL